MMRMSIGRTPQPDLSRLSPPFDRSRSNQTGTPDPPESIGVEAPPPSTTARIAADPASLGGWAATLWQHDVALRPELLSAARAFVRAHYPSSRLR